MQAGKLISKTVRERQLKRMRPRHYEILLRYMKGQRPKQIASEMPISRQRLSVIINSPVFQAELWQRWEVEEQELIKRLAAKENERLDAVTAMMRYGVGHPSILKQPSIFNLAERRRKTRRDTRAGIGEIIIEHLSQMKPGEADKTQAETLPPRTSEKPRQETGEPQRGREPNTEPSHATTKEAPTPPTMVQAARFYSEALADWIWLVLPYPDERLTYYEAKERLQLIRGTTWNTYPRSAVPHGNYACYPAEDISQLRGKAPQELSAFHAQKRRK